MVTGIISTVLSVIGIIIFVVVAGPRRHDRLDLSVTAAPA